MNPTNPQRKEISQYLAENASEYWGVIRIYSMLYDASSDIHISLDVRMSGVGESRILRIFAHDPIDYVVRPPDPVTIEGGPQMKFFTDGPRLDSPALQYVPGGDGISFNPPKRYQLLELDRTWIIAVSFEVEILHSAMWTRVKRVAAIKEGGA